MIDDTDSIKQAGFENELRITFIEDSLRRQITTFSGQTRTDLIVLRDSCNMSSTWNEKEILFGNLIRKTMYMHVIA